MSPVPEIKPVIGHPPRRALLAGASDDRAVHGERRDCGQEHMPWVPTSQRKPVRCQPCRGVKLGQHDAEAERAADQQSGGADHGRRQIAAIAWRPAHIMPRTDGNSLRALHFEQMLSTTPRSIGSAQSAHAGK